MKESIIVLGMHRSGTSVVAGLVSILGAYTGSDLMKPSNDNPKGYFENNKFVLFNEKIFLENGGAWEDYNFTLREMPTEKFNKYVLLAKKIIQDELKYAKKIVIKDPRMCVLFPIWEQALNELRIKIKIVFVYRSPVEVAFSLKKRDDNDLSIQQGLMLWSHYFFLSEKYSRNHERFFVHYNDDFYKFDYFLQNLADFIGSKITESIADDAVTFYSPKLKHQHIGLDNISPELPSYLTGVVQLLLAHDFKNKEKLDKYHLQFDQAKDFFLCNEKTLIKKLVDQEKNNKALTDQLDKKNKENIKLELDLNLLKNKFDEIYSQLLAQNKQWEQVTSALKKEKKQDTIEQSQQKNEFQQFIKIVKDKEKVLKKENIELRKEIKQLNKEMSDKTQSIFKLNKTLYISDSILIRYFSDRKIKRLINKSSKITLLLKLKHTLFPFFLKKIEKEKKIIIESGLFSPLFYLSSYPDVFSSGMDPLTHFCKFGWKEGRFPVSYFDCNEYLRLNQDVADEGVNPLVHYIKYGRAENRSPKIDMVFFTEKKNSIRNKFNKLKKNNKNNKYLILRTVQSGLNIAIVVHIFYLDLWDEILEKLKKIKHAYTLYITTTHDLYNDVLKLEKPSVIVKILRFENIGMDIYPFIETLNVLKKDKIDVFCKIHTKRGNEATGKLWRDSLLNHSIGNNDIFSSIAFSFEKNKKLKLVGSAFFYKSIGYLSRDYLQNINEALKHFTRRNVDLLNSGFFAGTMFWGRVSDFYSFSEVLSSVNFLQSNSSTDADGTFTHVAERLFGLPHLENREVGIVYKINNNEEYVIETIDASQCVKNNISATIRLLKSFDLDYFFLKNNRMLFNENYKNKFEYLNQNGIDRIYHYLTVGRFYFNHKLPIKVSDLVRRNKFAQTNLLSSSYLGLYGGFYNQKGIANNYEILRHKISIYETHLIDWNLERGKNKNKDLVSIVIPAYGQSKLTDNCIDSILSNDAGTKYEIILVNNSQCKSDIESLKKWEKYSRIKIINNNENLNFALGCNLGFSRSIGHQVVFLNNDTTVTKKWLVNLLDPLDNENISIAQPRLLYPDGMLQCMGLVFSSKSDLAYPLYQNQNISNKILSKNRLFQAVTGACLAVRAEDFSLVRGFDTSFINGQEDVDFCLKLNNLKNTKAIYVNDSIVYHHEAKSAGRGKFVANNRQTFLQRYSGKITSDDTTHYNNDGFFIEEWLLDSEHFAKLKVENYIPKLKKVENHIPKQNKNIFDMNESFCIKGSSSSSLDKKNILVAAHAVADKIFGGERSFLDMIVSIDKSKFNIIVTIPNNKNKNYIDILKKHTVRIYIVPYKMWDRSGIDNYLVKVLENIYRNNEISLVYVNTIMCKEPLKAAKNREIKSIVHVREVITKDEHLRRLIPQYPIKTILSDIVSNSDFLIANSKITSKMLDTKNKDILYNSINVDLFKEMKNTPDRKKIIFALISSNIPKKGIIDFFRIAKICRKIAPNAFFLLIGPINSYTKKIKRDINRFSMPNIKVAGYYSSPYEAIKSCNVVLNLSHFAESFGRTVGEALAGGRPVIAYEFGAISELVENNKNGFMVKHGDIDGIASHVKFLSENISQIVRLGNNGRKSIARLSSPEVYRHKLNSILHYCYNELKCNMSKQNKKINIIIPIFNAYNEVVNCIDSVINTVNSSSVKITLIDDSSTDDRIKKVLNNYSKIKNITVLYNKENIGYTKTVNKGINASKDDDVVLLNSDTIVTFNWLEELYKTAYSNSTIGTVTAMSDNAGSFSFPKEGVKNTKPPSVLQNNYAKIITKNSKYFPPVNVATGSGFCIYLKRKLLDEIGLFDEKRFSRGYGEENDFCMRAIKFGWRNVISPGVFIFHTRTASFGMEKESLVKKGLKEVIKKYPNYNEEVKKSFGSDDINKLRKCIQNDLDSLNDMLK
jgi:GT2 family glycosyltransferase